MIPLNIINNDIINIISNIMINDKAIIYNLIIMNDNYINNFFNINIPVVKSTVEYMINDEIKNKIKKVESIIYNLEYDDNDPDGFKYKYFHDKWDYFNNILKCPMPSFIKYNKKLYLRNIKKYIFINNIQYD